MAQEIADIRQLFHLIYNSIVHQCFVDISQFIGNMHARLRFPHQRFSMMIEWGIALLQFGNHAQGKVCGEEKLLMWFHFLCFSIAMIHQTLSGKYVIVSKMRVVSLQMKHFQKVFQFVNPQFWFEQTHQTQRVKAFRQRLATAI